MKYAIIVAITVIVLIWVIGGLLGAARSMDRRSRRR